MYNYNTTHRQWTASSAACRRFIIVRSLHLAVLGSKIHASYKLFFHLWLFASLQLVTWQDESEVKLKFSFLAVLEKQKKCRQSWCWSPSSVATATASRQHIIVQHSLLSRYHVSLFSSASAVISSYYFQPMIISSEICSFCLQLVSVQLHIVK